MSKVHTCYHDQYYAHNIIIMSIRLGNLTDHIQNQCMCMTLCYEYSVLIVMHYVCANIQFQPKCSYNII